MKIKQFLLILSLTLVHIACSTTSKSIMMGAIAGGTVGLGVGKAQNQNSKEATTSVLIGASLGSLIGYWTYNSMTKNNDTLNIKKDNIDEIEPFLTKPKIRSYIVPDTIEGNKYIKSHRVFILEDPGSWSR